MSRPRSLPAPASNIDPPLVADVVDVSSVDYVPTGVNADKIIRSVNISVAGVLYMKDLAGNTNPEYFTVGWQPCHAAKAITHNASNTATVLKAGLCAATIDNAV